MGREPVKGDLVNQLSVNLGKMKNRTQRVSFAPSNKKLLDRVVSLICFQPGHTKDIPTIVVVELVRDEKENSDWFT